MNNTTTHNRRMKNHTQHKQKTLNKTTRAYIKKTHNRNEKQQHDNTQTTTQTTKQKQQQQNETNKHKKQETKIQKQTMENKHITCNT